MTWDDKQASKTSVDSANKHLGHDITCGLSSPRIYILLTTQEDGRRAVWSHGRRVSQVTCHTGHAHFLPLQLKFLPPSLPNNHLSRALCNYKIRTSPEATSFICKLYHLYTLRSVRLAGSTLVNYLVGLVCWFLRSLQHKGLDSNLLPHWVNADVDLVEIIK